ncbi:MULTISPECIES: hypothetical protein [unclassified Cytobacillus]|uniref:hypothetical protein n=1 Tax=unclassified Cytobacillus TaxID=2675268 RepID=UPI0013F9353A|nr:hypothetical protein [Cytobacillus sp. AMY 15.2]KAF0819783.1 hypothetical protein KIS4809_1055 [Bacillus sp. ZZV12-4809]MCM3092339.1 hypothetical protein [Cytobacillus sp. AMY 15.2]
MIHEPVIAAVIILALIAVGEIISIFTKARVSMFLVAIIGYLLLIWTGIIPKELIGDSKFIEIGAVLGTAPIIIHMGTLIPLKVIRSQWKAVAISLLGIIFGTGLILLLITMMYGYKTAVAGAGPLTGGVIAFLVTAEGLKEVGLASLVVIPALILSFQSLFGMPLSAILLRRYALKYRKAADARTYTASTLEVEVENVITTEDAKELNTAWIPKKYQTNLILLFQLFIGGAIAVVLEQFTGIPYSIWALVLGIGGRLIGFYPDRVMERANAFTVGMAGLVFLIIATMNDTTFEMFIGYLPEMFSIIAVGILGIIIGGFIGSKLFKWDPLKGLPVALTATIGFPGDYLICEEVSRSVGRNKEEEEMILNEILTPMLIGGFTTVTAGSVVIASILIKTL